MNEAILDASALLVLLNDEPGSKAVAESLPGAAVSAVNLSEVVAKLADRGMPLESIRSALDGLGLEVHPFGAESAFAAGNLRPATKSLGLSLGDRACLALGKSLSRTVLTADRRWKSLALGVKVQVLR